MHFDDLYVDLIGSISNLNDVEKYAKEQHIIKHMDKLGGDHLMAACNNPYAVNILDRMLTIGRFKEMVN